MIPILFASSATDFTTNGLGRLADTISCYVDEERNGAYELELTYPIDGIHYEDISVGNIVCVIPSDGATLQAFEIYRITRPLNGRVTINAEHISYRLNRIPVLPFTADTCALALDGLKQNAAEPCPFTFHTDKVIDGLWTNPRPASIRSKLGGTEGSILERFQGEYEFDNFDVWLHTHRGSNNGVTIRYGKNLTDLEQETNIENTINGILPYWENEETQVIGSIQYAENVDNFPYHRTLPLDLSDEWEEPPTVEELNTEAQNYIARNNIGVPSVNLKISFVALWQTEEYKDLTAVERVKLCDTITVQFERLGVSATAQVIRTRYNALLERYEEIEVGDARTTLGDTITQISDESAEQVSSQFAGQVQSQIDAAADKLAGGLGGHVIINRNANGEPNEILIMDTDDRATATYVIRMNSAGIGFSQNGYAGPYNSAWTIDGTLDMSQINVLNLTANLIKGGVLQLGTIDNTAGILQVFDEENALIGQLDKSGLKMWGADGSYVLMNQQVGFAGYDRNDNKIYWVSGEEFHQRKSVIEEEITLCNTMRFIPITITDSNQNIVNDGIALVSA